MFQTAILFLKIVIPERLDRHADLISTLHNEYGTANWFFIYRADRRMRREHMLQPRRDALITLERLGPADSAKWDFDPDHVWDSVFGLALAPACRPFWDNVHRKVVFNTAGATSKGALTHDGTVFDWWPPAGQGALASGIAPPQWGKAKGGTQKSHQAP